MDRLQKFVLALSVLSLAGWCGIAAAYLDFRIEAARISDFLDAVEFEHTHPGGAIHTLLGNLFFVLNGGSYGLATSVQLALELLLFLLLFALSIHFIFQIVRRNADGKGFLLAGVFHSAFYFVVASGMIHIYSECYPIGRSWCGFSGTIAIVAVAWWFLLFSLAILVIETVRRHQGE